MAKAIVLRCKLCKRIKFAHDDDYEKVVNSNTLRYIGKKVRKGEFTLVKVVCPYCNPEPYGRTK